MEIAPWIKIAYTLFVCTLVPVYLRHYGASNFLWFSDVALLAMVPALWLENALVASMMTLAVGLPELAWNLDFVWRLVSGRPLLGLADYMFDAGLPLFLRALSLFHVILPLLLLWTLHRLGYDGRALPAQTALGVLLIALSYALTDPEKNINWVFGPGASPQHRVSPRLYVAAVLVFFPVVVYWPTHEILRRLFAAAR